MVSYVAKIIKLSHGGGGKEMQELLRDIFKILPPSNDWRGRDQDAAYRNWPGRAPRSSAITGGKDGAKEGRKLVFTTDSYIVDPLFFPGGDIGKLAICGTINDLAVMGAEPLGISLALIIEEGFAIDDLKKILRSLAAVAWLMAIFQARPSPFYIVDEVEAALDDANLGRLLQVFETLRENSQLIIITHQKRTMEIADALYGVSMRQDGISAVVGQRIGAENEVL